MPLALLAPLLLAACSDEQPAGPSAQTARAYLAERAARVTVIRDDFGVPHIYAETDADAVFGMLYAQAEDDFPRVERNYIWAIGRLAEVEGEAALMSDLRAHLYMTGDEARAAYASAPDWLKELCIAFADGLNWYLMANPEVQPRLIDHFEPWMPMYFFEGSIGGDIEQIPLDGIEAFYGGDEPRDVIASARPPDTEEPAGSNGFAISGELTASGSPLLLINPHTSFYFRPEIHVVSEEGLNAYGAVTWGQFFVYQGFNEHTGWMHTSTYVDFLDEFVQDIVDDDGTLKYRYGDELRNLEISEVTLRYKNGEAYDERSFLLYRTHHGPITHMLDGRWVATKINWDPVNALIQSFMRTKQKDYAGFRETMNIRTNSSNNTVFADSSGNIAYFHGNFVPRRDPAFDYSKPVDGSNPATDWQGLHTVDETVTLLNPANGWLQNSNSTPFTAALEFSPKREDYPVYMAPDAENYRGIHAVEVLTGIEDVTLDSLIELAYDPYLPAFARLAPALIEAYDKQPDDSLHEAISLLRDWDYRVRADSVAMTLMHFYATRLQENIQLPEDLKNGSRMSRLEYVGIDAPADKRLRMFAETIAELQGDFGSWRMPWAEVNRFQRLTGDIDLPFDDDKPSLGVSMASGRWGALAAFGSRREDGTKKLYGYRGNSFVAAVEFGDKVTAKSLLAGGQSGDPESTHFDDQAERYVSRDFKEVAFYREDVETRALSVYQPGL
ncbi:MAG: penicillin acylase family protein [Pseudomonadota bacterium]